MRACELVEMLGAGEVVDGVIDIDNSGYKPTVLHLDAEWTNRFLGTDIPEERMKKILSDLHFWCKRQRNHRSFFPRRR